MAWNLATDRPIYLQLMEQIGYLIVSGIYHPGCKLPSVRDLAGEAAVNPNTMQKALTELERSGLIYANRTAGRFITEDTDMILKMRHKLAKEELQLFLEKMKLLGLSHQEIIELLNESARDSE